MANFTFMVKTILIIDDELDIRVLLKYNLEKEGYVVLEAPNGSAGIELAKTSKPDLILLDVMMPDMDGIETCELIKTIPELQGTVICFLTARGEDYSQLAGYEAGADDYIVKPIKPKLLISKIAAIFRRAESNVSDTVVISENQQNILILDREQYLVYKDNQSIALPRKEFELLALLMSKIGKVFKREEILKTVWGNEVVVGDRTIDVHIRKLRMKIGGDIIQTVKGVGYKITL